MKAHKKIVNTKEIMAIALKLVGFESVPADSAIYVEGENIRKVLFGIDAAVPELLLAKQLGYDAVISHHPKGGFAAINFYQVFKKHIQQMVDAGVPKHEAEEAVRRKMKALEVEGHTRNYGHAVDVARFLKMPYLNVHTPLDELGRRIMAEKIKQVGKDATVGDVVSALKKLPEFAKTYFKHGINTLIYIHISPADLEKLKTDGVGNLIITGHIASDSVGINPFIKELENRGISVTRLGIVSP